MSQSPTTRKGIEQGRAKYAFEAVKRMNEDTLKKQKEYKSAAKKLPVLIKTNGLGQSLAFIKKRNDGYDKLYEQLGDWLQIEDAKQLVPKGELVEQVIQLQSPVYRQVTVETLALLNWVRRFVDGLMKDVEPSDD
ncbi:MAG: type III-B CRISPR module-associated protein Cmr5 [Caldilineaceae bacterium]|nr:type III-B CRISPR module-associated protein Cmr5 [Caldilineaceae bacterium]